MKCPKCGNKTHIYDVQKRKDGTVWRRRECLQCKFRFTTLEEVISKKPKVDTNAASYESGNH